MPRPRRAATKAFQTVEDPDADPEFLALSEKQKRKIDRAFERGLGGSKGSRKRKREKRDDVSGAGMHGDVGGVDLDGGFVDDHAAGGFVDDGGGYVDESGGFVTGEDEGGGFMVDDEGGGFMVDDEAGGGFLPDNEGNGGGFIQSENEDMDPTRPRTASHRVQSTTESSIKKQIPLSLIPQLLASLDLPTDEDVLQVFNSCAKGWEGDSSRSKKDARDDSEVEEKGVSLKDWRAVCSALIGPEKESSEDEEEDVFDPEDDNVSESSLSSLSPEPVEKPSRSKRSNKNEDLEEKEEIKLSSRQREMVDSLWTMVKPNLVSNSKGPKGLRGADRILGRDEVKGLVRSLGEMWSEEEITEMVTLFSTQHEGRGLSYEDFGKVMVRARLV